MTTQINVIVDNGGLSAKAKQQTQANRWQKLESDNRQKVEATGTQQRDANRAQQGIGPDGRPLYGTPPAQPLRRDEPAAMRTSSAMVGHCWEETKQAETTPVSTGLYGYNYSEQQTLSVNSFARQTTQLRSGDGYSLTGFSLPFGTYESVLPTAGLTWQPNYGAAYSNGAGWTFFAFGPRTFRHAFISQNDYVHQALVLPAGRGNCIVFVFKQQLRYCIDVTTMHYIKTAPLGGNETDIPTMSEISTFLQTQTGFFNGNNALAFLPGARIDIGRPGFLGGISAYVYDSSGNRTQVNANGYYDGYAATPFSSPTSGVVNESVSAETEVYCCSRTAIRKLTPTSSVQAFIDYWNAPQTERETVNLKTGGSSSLLDTSVSVPRRTTRIGQLLSLSPTSGLFFQSVASARTWDPRIFQVINEAHAFTSSTNILSQNQIQHQLRDYDKAGVYAQPSLTDVGFSLGIPYYYGKSLASQPDTEVGQRAGTVTLNPNRPALEAGPILHRVWDWGRPDYCRARLLDMGFNEADLTS